METKNILVVSRSTEKCVNALHTGIDLARKLDARLHIVHILEDPFSLSGWNLPIPSLEQEYKAMVAKARAQLDGLIQEEKARGLVVEETVRDGNPADAVREVVERENVDLILMPAHQEGRLEHFLFGKVNDDVIRSLPASLMLVK